MISTHPKWVKLTSIFTLRQTALHVASEYGKANSMAALLEWGADVDAQETLNKMIFAQIINVTNSLKISIKGRKWLHATPSRSSK